MIAVPISHRTLHSGLLVLIGLVLHLILWRYSEPPYLFGDFYKAYFPAAQRVWELGPREAFQHLEIGVGGFVNMPILVWAFVPLLAFGFAGSPKPWMRSIPASGFLQHRLRGAEAVLCHGEAPTGASLGVL